MKKYIIVVLLLILFLVIFFYIKEDSIEMEDEVSDKQREEITEQIELPEKEIEVDELFPEIYRLSELKTDTGFPLIKFHNLKDTVTVNSVFMDVAFELPSSIKKADVFLFVNNSKRDMFFQVGGKTLTFKRVLLKEDKNIIEIFYRIGNKRSLSSYSVVNFKTGE